MWRKVDGSRYRDLGGVGWHVHHWLRCGESLLRPGLSSAQVPALPWIYSVPSMGRRTLMKAAFPEKGNLATRGSACCLSGLVLCFSVAGLWGQGKESVSGES